MSEDCKLGEVRECDVEPAKVELARKALEFWKKNYGGDDIRVRWMRRDLFSFEIAKIENAIRQLSGSNQSNLNRGYEEDSPTVQGFVRKRILSGKTSDVFLVSDIRADQIQRTLFHELYHKVFADENEGRAEKFAERAGRELAEEKKCKDDEERRAGLRAAYWKFNR